MIAWWGRRRHIEGTIPDGELYPPEWRAGRPRKAMFAEIPETGIRAALQNDMNRVNGLAAGKIIKVPLQTGPWSTFSPWPF